MASSKERRIVEVNGVKMEIDLRTARTVDSYKVGDNVKLLRKEYDDSYKSLPAVIVGFDQYETLPTIVIAYLEDGYGSSEIKFAYLNAKSADLEICPMNSLEVCINKNIIVEKLNRGIDQKEREVAELKLKREYFLEMFGQYFERGEQKTEGVSSGLDA